MVEQSGALEMKTRIFFDRPADVVATELAAEVYEKDDQVITREGEAKELEIATPEGIRKYRIMHVEAYLERQASRIWKGKRAEELRLLSSGETKTYRSRSGNLTFIKTQGADNILIRVLEDTATKETLRSATQVSSILGLSHGDEGRLTLVDDNRFRFIKL